MMLSSKKRHFIIFFGILFLLVVHGVIYHGKLNSDRSIAEIKFSSYLKVLNKQIESDMHLLEPAAKHWSKSKNKSRIEFSEIMGFYMKINNNFNAVEWIPKVRSAERKSFIDTERSKGHFDFDFKQIATGKQMQIQTPADFYFPVHFIEPLVGNEKALGLDLYSEPNIKATIDIALKTKSFAITRPLKIVQNTESKKYSFLMFYPINGEPRNNSLNIDDKEISGFLLGVLSLEKLHLNSIKGFDSSDFEIEFKIGGTGADEAEILRLDATGAIDRRLASVNSFYTLKDTVTLGKGLIEVAYFYKEKPLFSVTFIEIFLSFLFGTGFIAVVASMFSRTEGRLVESQKLNIEKALQLENAQQIAKIGSWSFDVQTKFLVWSSEQYKIFEITEPQTQEMLYKISRSRVHPDDQAKVDILVEKMNSQGADFTLEHRLQFENGRTKYVVAIGKATKLINGIPVEFCGTLQDITERVENNFRLVESEQLLSTTLRMLPVAVFGKNIEKDFQWNIWNKQAEELFGLKAKDCIGKYDRDFFSKEQAEFFKQKDLEASQSFGIVDTPEELAQTPKGEVLLRTRKIVIRSENGKPKFLLGITEDITDRKKQEQHLKEAELKLIRASKFASLGEMSAGIAHEINNPLAIISGSAELLQKYISNPEKLAARVETIKKSCNRIAKIVGGLKKFSRSGDVSNFEPYRLGDIVNEVITLTETHSKYKNVPVTVNNQSSSLVDCDVVEMEQVLINLVNNAIDATHSLAEKWVKVSIYEEADSVFVRVMDSGRGIPQELHEKLFDPFFTTKTVGEGTGLGLSITKGILDEHKATIRVVADSPNTCFEIQFSKVAEKIKQVA